MRARGNGTEAVTNEMRVRELFRGWSESARKLDGYESGTHGATKTSYVPQRNRTLPPILNEVHSRLGQFGEIVQGKNGPLSQLVLKWDRPWSIILWPPGTL